MGTNAGKTDLNAWRSGAALVALTLLVYLPATRCGYIWDDDYHVTNNQTLRSLDGLKQIWLKPGAVPQYYPVTHTSFWVEYQLWGVRPLGYHLDNILLHAVNALLLWRVLRQLRVPGAWVAAAIFAVHPVHVESVVWITERKNVLSGCFYLLAALQYLRFGEGRNRRAYALALALFVAALLSKSVTASFPAAMLLIVYWKRGAITRRDVLPLIPFFALGLGMSAVTSWMEKHVVGASGPEFALAFSERIRIAGTAVWFYLSKLNCPWPLIFSYPRWKITGAHWFFVVAAVGVVLALASLRKRLGRGPLVAVLFFGGTLLPALGFIDVLPMRYSFVADHFQYLASIGMIALIVAVVARVFPSKIFAAIVICVLGLLTWRQCFAYKNAETLWVDTLKKNPSSWMAENNLGMILFQRGDLDTAEKHFRRSLELNPQNDKARDNLAKVLYQQGKVVLSEGRIAQAADRFIESLQLDPNLAEAHNNLGVILASNGRHAEAVEHFHRALELNPQFDEARKNLAQAEKRVTSGK